MKHSRNQARAVMSRRSTLAVALAMGMGITSLAWGQSTTGGIFGHAPEQSGETVVITNQNTGATQQTTVRDGDYSISQLPLGTYTVTLKRDGETISEHDGVRISAGAGTAVNFRAGGGAENAQEMGAVQVSAAAMPDIDVSSVTSTYSLSSEELARLPIGESADSIALMAPSTTSGSSYFGGISVGGAGQTENAYYVNGFNTTSLYSYTGNTFNIPYGAIAQQETIEGGFSAKYGRADGGVINQVGKSGSNDWHFGGRIQWEPRSLKASPANTYYPQVDKHGGKFANQNVHPGELYQYRNDNQSWLTRYSAYASGPLVEDKLFFFIAGEYTKSNSRYVSPVSAGQSTRNKSHSADWYAKINWNINEDNLLEFTYLQSSQRNNYGTDYLYDNDKHVDLQSTGTHGWSEYENKTRIWHYTGYLTDRATLSVIYGETEVKTPTYPKPIDKTFVSGAALQNPALNGGTPNTNAQTTATVGSKDARTSSKGLRADLSYDIGDHQLTLGIDNLHYWANNQGDKRSGPGYIWIYGKQSNASTPISPAQNVGAPGAASDGGYFVRKDIFTSISSMSAEQDAWYIQDEWNLTSNFLLSIGLRNDSFTNYNGAGEAFVRQEDQWEPRLGFSWDVHGDSSLKIYGNAGRYYLALPQAVAERGATASTYTDQYFTYTGVNADGTPTGLKPVPTVDGDPAGPGPVSANGEFGQVPNPNEVTATNLEAQYQDEFILGFDQQLGEDWVYGAKATYRTLGSLVDDGCFAKPIVQAVKDAGYDPSKYNVAGNTCKTFNPGSTNVFQFHELNGSDTIRVPVTQAQTKMPDPQRDYYALNLHLEHPFDGTWQGRVDYTFSRSWGNSEGQVRSDIGQASISATEDWDYWQLMSASSGYMANHRRHKLKAHGYWQITPEWSLSGKLTLESGAPVNCLGFYGPNRTNPGGAYGSDYHWCHGEPQPPGSETTAWHRQLDLGIQYRPAFANQDLAFKLDVFNVTNEQKPKQLDPHFQSRYAHSVNNTYHMPLFYQTPRTMRLTVTYDY